MRGAPRLLLLLLLLLACALPAQDWEPSGARVPDAAAALRVAEPALIRVYGKHQIDYEDPLMARLENGVWKVYGTLCCPNRNGGRTCESGKCVGGVAALELRQGDGKVLSISHTK